MTADIIWTARNALGALREQRWPGGGVGTFQRVLTRARIGSSHTWTLDTDGGLRAIRITRVSRQHVWVHVISARGTHLMAVVDGCTDNAAQLLATDRQLVDRGLPPAHYRGQTLLIPDAVIIADEWIEVGHLDVVWRLAPSL